MENPKNEQRVNISCLKKALLRPGWILPQDIPPPPEDEKPKRINDGSGTKGGRSPVTNLKGRNIFTQKKKAKPKSVPQPEMPEDVAIERILAERIGDNNAHEFLVRWSGYRKRDEEWVPQSRINTEEVLDEWRRLQKYDDPLMKSAPNTRSRTKKKAPSSKPPTKRGKQK